MWKKIYNSTEDDFAFLRHRAAALLADGFKQEALYLLSFIDEEQVTRMKPLLDELLRKQPLFGSLRPTSKTEESEG